ncbi:zinc finger CCCH domain-containing protein 37-like isoform X1 [Primulina huaijiensis]|uniref:zinc finger CCCH domain-containing protein 37-like isoform X1 n=1 Tax=Primulina huaijiensis TaxID=1492673 RepID=UPI003CC76905
MANQLYGYNPSSYGGATTSMYSSRSIADSYLPTDTSLRGSAFRFLSADSLSAAAAAISSSMLYNPDSYSTKIPGVSVTTSTSSYAPPGVDLGSTITSTDSLYAGLKRASSDSLYHQLGAHYTIGQTEAWYSADLLAKRSRFESTSNLPIYPQRPGEKDCAFYMQTRACKFGESCKFDHPIWVPERGIPDWKEVPLVLSESLPERPGELNCPYFLKTQRCKFGVRCKFNHPKEALQGAPGDTDVSVLPERPSEPPCAFYMKTGNCKFGVTCKFHHPKGLQIQSAGEEIGAGLQQKISGDGKSPIFTPALSHNSKGLPIRSDGEDCPFYLKTGSCKYGATCRYNHPERNAAYPLSTAIAPSLLTSSSAHFNIGAVASAASLLPAFDPRLTQTMLGFGASVYPQRPGQQECDYYMKTGICKFGDSCKFHHPIDRTAMKFTLAGLPRREGAIHCPYYMKTGACKFGATCKFDHPPPGEVMAAAGATEGAAVSGVEGVRNGEEF